MFRVYLFRINDEMCKPQCSFGINIHIIDKIHIRLLHVIQQAYKTMFCNLSV